MIQYDGEEDDERQFPEIGSPIPMDQLPMAAPRTGASLMPKPAPEIAAPSDMDKYNHLIASGPGVSHLHGVGGDILKGLDIAGSVAAPGISALIPGTTMHNALLRNQALTQAKENQGAETGAAENEQRAAQTGLETAQTGKTEAETEAIKNPQPKPKEKEAAKIKEVQADDQGNAVAVFDDGTTKQLGYKIAPKAEPDRSTDHITVMQGGKPHVMGYNPQTKKYDVDQGEAPPSASATSAYANTRTVQLIDPKTNLPTVYQYDPKTEGYTKQVGTSSSGAYGHQIAQAGLVTRAGDDLISQIDQHRDKVGNVGAILDSAFLGTPLSDPEQSALAAQIVSWAATNPAMHGLRGMAALNEIKNVVGGIPNNPDSLIAAIRGIERTAAQVSPGAGGASAIPRDAPVAPKEDGKVLKKGGKVIAVSKGGAWQAQTATQ